MTYLTLLGLSRVPDAQNPDEMDNSGGEFVPPDDVVMPSGEMSAEMQNLSEAERQAIREEGLGADAEVNQMLVAAVIQVLAEKDAQ